MLAGYLRAPALLQRGAQEVRALHSKLDTTSTSTLAYHSPKAATATTIHITSASPLKFTPDMHDKQRADRANVPSLRATDAADFLPISPLPSDFTPANVKLIEEKFGPDVIAVLTGTVCTGEHVGHNEAQEEGVNVRDEGVTSASCGATLGDASEDTAQQVTTDTSLCANEHVEEDDLLVEPEGAVAGCGEASDGEGFTPVRNRRVHPGRKQHDTRKQPMKHHDIPHKMARDVARRPNRSVKTAAAVTPTKILTNSQLHQAAKSSNTAAYDNNNDTTTVKKPLNHMATAFEGVEAVPAEASGKKPLNPMAADWYPTPVAAAYALPYMPTHIPITPEFLFHMASMFPYGPVPFPVMPSMPVSQQPAMIAVPARQAATPAEEADTAEAKQAHFLQANQRITILQRPST